MQDQIINKEILIIFRESIQAQAVLDLIMGI
jgi:hypothetical protein